MATSVILICDSSKFGAQSFAKFAALSDVDAVITDNGIDGATLEKLNKMNIDIEVV